MKPSNILLTDDDRVKIIDLGQACELGCVKKRIQGTPGYMAPEQAHRQAITAQTDIYNFGATMYWVLTREVIPTALPPKEDSNSLYSGALDAEMVKPPVPPIARLPDMPPLLSADIMECVQIHPDDRPSSMEQIVRHLDALCKKLEADGAAGDPA
jgi:serine/threonine-protein kinase